MQGNIGGREAILFEGDGKRGLRDRMNIMAAAEAHVVWKNRLARHIRGDSHEPLGAAMLGQDDVCQLNNLINGAAFNDFQKTEEFGLLSRAHAQFHHLSRVVVERLKADDLKGAAELFENEYRIALDEMLQSLKKINGLLS